MLTAQGIWDPVSACCLSRFSAPHTHPILVGWGALWSPVNVGVHRARLPAFWGSAYLTGKNLGPSLGGV